MRPAPYATLKTMAYDETFRQVALIKLAQNGGLLLPTAKALHIAPVTLKAWRDEATQTASTSTEIASQPDTASQEPTGTQTQPELIASDSPSIPEKEAKVALYSQIVDRYGLKVLDLVDTQMSAVQAATVLGIATQRMQELAEGRHKQPAQVVEQHLHTGPEYHRAAQANAAKHPKHRRKTS